MSCFSGVLNQSDAFASLNRAWTTGSRPVGAVGLSETGKALVLHALYEQQKKPLLVLTPDEASAVKLTEDLRTLQGDVLLYPAREMNFVQVAGASHEYELLRLDVLSRMAAGAYTAVVAPVAAACQLTMPPAELLGRTRTVNVGDDVPPGQLVQALVAAGYVRYDQVDGTSQFALRGGILDIFPPGRTEPVRLEFWGDTIESMTAFDLATQRRTEALNSLRITPSAEVLFADVEKTAKAIEALAAGLRGKATKAREKLLTDADTLRKTGTLPCKDKYLPLVYQSNGLFDYCNGLLAVCDSAKVKEKCNNANRLFFFINCKDIFQSQRLEIQLVGSVVVCGYRLRVTVYNDRGESELTQCFCSMYAAIIEFDTLTDSVRTAAEDHYLLFAVVYRAFVLDMIAGVIVCGILSRTYMNTFPAFHNAKLCSACPNCFLGYTQDLA